MKTINRYILWELLQTFFFSLLAMTVLLVLIGLVQKAMENNIPIAQTIRLIPFVVVEMSRISIPMTFLLAITTFFAKMSGNNEVIALKSLGISPWTFLWPVMVLGIFVSLLTVWLNEMAITWGRAGAASVIYNAAEDIILNQLRTSHSFNSPSGDLKIMVKGVDDRQLISPTITLSSPPTVIEAKEANIRIDFSTQELTVTLDQPKVDGGDRIGYSGPMRVFKFPLDRIVDKKNEGDKRPADMGLNEVAMQIEKTESDIEGFRRNIAAQKAFAVCLGSPEQCNPSPLNETKKWYAKQIERLNVEPPRRWATGFSCLFFIWIGAPLAIWMRKTDIFSSFFACFCPILLLYYPLLMFGMQGAKKGTLPAEFVWIANICIGIIGLWFLKRIQRY